MQEKQQKQGKINKTADILQYRKDYYSKNKEEFATEIVCPDCGEKLQKRSLYNHKKKFHTTETREEIIDKIFELAEKHKIKITLDFDISA